MREAIIQRVSASKKSKTGRSSRVIAEQPIVQEELKELVIQNQNKQSEGYYSYQDWLHVNELLFSGVERLAPELWKILRIVNFGEVSIPTGLVYEVLAILKNPAPQSDKEHMLVDIINNFLEVNQVRSSFYTLKELNNYKPLSTIIEGYMFGDFAEEPSSVSRKPDPKVFEDLYQDAKTRSEKKTLKCITSQKNQLKDCTFAPYVSSYPLQEKSILKNSHHSKRCAASAQKYKR